MRSFEIGADMNLTLRARACTSREKVVIHSVHRVVLD